MKIRWKIIFSVIIVSVFVNTFFTLYLVNQERIQEENRLRDKIARTNKLVSVINQRPIWNYDPESLNTNVDLIYKDPEIIGVHIEDTIGVINLESYKENKSKVGKRIDTSVTIEKEDKKIGRAEIVYTTSVSEMRKLAVRNQMFMITLFLLVINSIVIFVISKILLKPIDAIVNGLQEINKGNYNYKMSLNTQDEFKEIEIYFNKMTKDLANSYKHIEEQNLELKDVNEDLKLRIKKQVEAEEALADSEKKYRGIFENAMEGIFQCTFHGRFISANPQMAKILGYDSVEDLMLNVSNIGLQLFVEPEQRVKFVNLLQNEQKTLTNFECQMFRKDKEIIWASIRGRSITDSMSKLGHIEGLLEDITERKLAEEEVCRTYEELEQRVGQRTVELKDAMDKLKSTQEHLVESEKMAALGGLVAGVAHEINTPIGVGVTAASFLQQSAQKLTELVRTGQLKKSDLAKFLDGAKESTETILSNLDRAANLIKSFKQVAVDQTGEQTRKFNVKEYMNEILVSLKPKYKREGHNVRVNCPDNLEYQGYPGLFSQIITNFVNNTIVHGFEGIENGEIKIDITSDAEFVYLEYSDNGKGMNEDTINHIFDPFFTTKRGKGGTGLGMHIVFNIITQKLNGEIKCTSVVGQGTTFFIKFPRNSEA